jgi:hypothetical protein
MLIVLSSRPGTIPLIVLIARKSHAMERKVLPVTGATLAVDVCADHGVLSVRQDVCAQSIAFNGREVGVTLAVAVIADR